MFFIYSCRICGRRLIVLVEYAEAVLRCPSCQTTFKPATFPPSTTARVFRVRLEQKPWLESRVAEATA